MDFEYNILAGTSADSILKNIQFLNAYSKKYIAIWDNDDEGRRHYNKAKKVFGEKEAIRFDLLPCKKSDGNKKSDRKMEDMFDLIDFENLVIKLNLPKDSTYESIISELYFSSEIKRKNIIDSLSIGTKNNFEILKKIIIKKFDNTTKLENERNNNGREIVK